MSELRARFGEIDIYLFDQLLKGRFDGARTVLDAGCGSGRNLVYFLQNGFDVFGTDRDPDAIARVRRLAARLAPHAPPDRFHLAAVEAMPFGDVSMDAVLSSAVLHFARTKRTSRPCSTRCGGCCDPAGSFSRGSRPASGSRIGWRRSGAAATDFLTVRSGSWWMRPFSQITPAGSAPTRWTPSRPRSSRISAP